VERGRVSGIHQVKRRKRRSAVFGAEAGKSEPRRESVGGKGDGASRNEMYILKMKGA